MARIPFGIARLDSIIGGGAPPGSVVLLSGEAGAGAREFVHTSAAMNGLYYGDSEAFDLHYGDMDARASPPDEIHYVSFTAGGDDVEREMGYTMNEELVRDASDHVHFCDLSPEYFQLSPIPRSWYAGKTRTVNDLAAEERRESALEALADYLGAHAAGNLVVVDSVTDLVAAVSDDMTWSDIALLMKGIQKAAYDWGGLILLLVQEETLAPTELGHLMDAASGTLQFGWESGGSKRARTMFVREFRGVLSRIEQENIIRFETEVHEGGFDVSGVRKIR
ncbi:RecA-superfamily ATPase, KaiC/GvpD/RAD55 family [Haloplanus vescus]|uniref:RecA-superfamily ATPase, KaiC/GvpD/RAD55 family n=1 Tax=Haloplanus vescus TaxID=555874 RepID=A0A1H4AKF0_9EURY|nr:HTR-like protein [Haloplanus vescus]SEA36390.1 RecA-superfamily ATPase, KaiC/GvpD/RAD55 family [Haloplanus vescus]